MLTALLIITPLLFYLLTRKVRVSVIKDGTWRVDLHFTLFAIPFKKRLNKRKSKSEKKSDKKGSGGIIFRHVTDALAHAELEVRRLTVPMLPSKNDIAAAVTMPWKYHSVISALLALVHSRAKKLTVRDNAITLIPDSNEILIDASITIRLFHVILTYLAIKRDEKRMKRGRTDSRPGLRCRKIR